MRALTLTQPWATLVAIGAKRIETRSWSTGYRGPVAIHAAKGFPAWARQTCAEEPFASALRAAGITGPSQLPLGAVVATAVIEDVLHTEAVTWVQEDERAFGDYEDGRFAWFLRDVVRLPKPVPARGALGLWEWSRS